MLDATTTEKIADELVEADRTRTPVPLITARKERGLQAGRKLVGRKMGLTSKVMQAATGAPGG